MSLVIDRRHLLLTATLGAGAFAIPGFAAAQGLTRATGFTHSVASGEPAADSMLLWTRFVGAGDAAAVRCEVSETADFARVAGGAAQVTGPWRDWTVKATVAGLRPGTDYHYRFVAPDGSFSPVGRTRTLPDGRARRFRLGVFSCSNLGFGWFNAYAHAAARDDLDAWLHLGDYFYEYGPGGYPPRSLPGRVPVAEPAREIVALADYRLRYASYRADPDLQALHARLPMIAQWDDHETANDAWEGGAQNHDAGEGDWGARKAAAVQAYREWMPVSDEPWKAYDIGDLATLFRTETRLFARTREADLSAAFAGDAPRLLAAYRDGAWRDTAATMLGTQQEAWLARAMRASVASGRRWQVLGSGTNVGLTSTPPEAEGWLAGMAAPLRRYVTEGLALSRAGLPSNLDNWGGFPAARARLLGMARAADADLVVLTGDSHNAWAFDLADDGRAAGVEFGGHSVTSGGYETALTEDPKRVAAAMVRRNPELKWCDTSRRGYMTTTFERERVSNDWLFVETVRARDPRASVGHSATVTRGRRRMA